MAKFDYRLNLLYFIRIKIWIYDSNETLLNTLTYTSSTMVHTFFRSICWPWNYINDLTAQVDLAYIGFISSRLSGDETAAISWDRASQRKIVLAHAIYCKKRQLLGLSIQKHDIQRYCFFRTISFFFFFYRVFFR